MDNISIYAVVVIYNKSCNNSITCCSLSDIDFINILVIDNSTSDFGNKEYCINKGWQYKSMDGNKGLSKAYNAALNILNDNEGILVWFDDDTAVEIAYFHNLIDTAKEMTDIDIFLPIVKDETGILSPCIIKKFHAIRIKELKTALQAEISAINSGMAVRLSVFKEYRYNENYFLDYVDHNFLREMKNNGTRLMLLNTQINQCFSDNEFSDLSSALKRFSIFLKDFKLFCSSSFIGYIYYVLYILNRGIKLSIKYKEMKFLLCSFKAIFGRIKD
jgi:rhamnosyltransferase